MENITANARAVLERRYLAKDENGQLVEDVEAMFRRVADAVAAADAKYSGQADTSVTANEFFRLMTSLRFLPNSPTLMNAGRPLGQLSACFVLPVEDSMEGIFETIKQAALIHKSGGGTGFSFSRLRQRGATVNSTGGVASGPVSFMKVFNTATEAVKQGGTRRGANMGILRVDHPDILDFIDCKLEQGEITNFNISVGLTEAFMDAVVNDSEYDLIDPKSKLPVKRLRAAEVFGRIVHNAWQNGEPGIIFLDRLNRDNVVPSQGDIESTNPCGEQPLLPYESCNLGSINLVKMLKKDDSGAYAVDYELLDDTVRSAVHFLDNVIDINNYPLDRIAYVTRQTRKIGLGVMGFADMLLLLGVAYNSNEGVALGEKIMSFINAVGHDESARLAIRREPFPLFYDSVLPKDRLMRNGTVTTIAPTGTLSIIGGCSSGVEPVFAYVYIRNVMDNTELVEVNPILKRVLKERGLYSDELMRRIADEGTLAHIEELPADIRDVFVCAHDISPEYHIKMQAAFQNETDNAVSKTVNFTSEATEDDVRSVYLLSYRLGCKGVTIYRDGSRDHQVLNLAKKEEPVAAAPEVEAPPAPEPPVVPEPLTPAVEPVREASETVRSAFSVMPAEDRVFPNVIRDAPIDPPAMTLDSDSADPSQTEMLPVDFGHIEPRKRPLITKGFTERVRIGCGNLYITVNYDENGICEVFTNTGKAGGCPSQSEATSRLISVALRSGISVKEIYDQLKGIRCPSTIRQKGMSCTSCPDAIAKVVLKVAKYIEGELTEMTPEKTSAAPLVQRQVQELRGQTALESDVSPARVLSDELLNSAGEGSPHSCPECGSPLEHEGGCVICRNCGYSKCN